ncbi:hypothetical protein [Pyxidicoccus trucidator]|uniref:hypothetical protein n=1 Tax=Pyxidicoccus trucidator TaxID=2709662 RepID=UPI0013DC1FB6|nr:hypothetical protein [Pyxidicoccus trucidator]
MTTRYLCASSSTCPSPDLTSLVEAVKGNQSRFFAEALSPEPAKPAVRDVELLCPHCKTRQMLDVMKADAEVKGRPIHDTEAAELDTLRASFAPQKSAERLEAFGTWLFGGTAFFTTLVGFYAYTVHDEVKAWSQLFFAIALALLGLSMAAAARMKTPALKTFNPDSPSSMRKALEERATERGTQLKFASGFFAAALAFAGAAPVLGALFTSKPEGHLTTSYTRDASGKLSVVMKATDMTPGEVFGARVRKKDASDTVLVEGAQAVKADGSGELMLEVPKLEAAGGPWELATYTSQQGNPNTEVSVGAQVLNGVAATAPEKREEPVLGVAFSYAPKGRLVLEAQGSAMPPREPVELHVRQGAQVLGWTRGLSAQDGAVMLKLEVESVDVSKEPVVLTVLKTRDGKLEPLFERQVPAPANLADGR